ncbi:MAG: hypothetical protein HYU48_02575 [Candidatus Levybacteria bacterium]|nr:hypothetical protein [Candidatus Levybacteria bacterium]
MADKEPAKPFYKLVENAPGAYPVLLIKRAEVRSLENDIYGHIEQSGVVGLAEFIRDLSTEEHILGLFIYYDDNQIIATLIRKEKGCEEPEVNANNENLARRKFFGKQKEQRPNVYISDTSAPSMEQMIQNGQAGVKFGSMTYLGWFVFE